MGALLFAGFHAEAGVEQSPNLADGKTVVTESAPFDLQFSFDLEAASGALGNAGAEFDGTYYYTTRWASNLIHQYDMSGNLIKEFSIPGVTGLRDLAFDGTYMYGGNAGFIIYQMDFINETLIGTIPSPQAVRHIAYDEGADAFWVGTWADNPMLVDRSGANLGVLPTGLSSQYGSAYDGWSDDGPYLWVFDQGLGGDTPQYIHQFDLNTLTATGLVYDVGADFVSTSDIAGGLFTVEGIVPGTASIGGVLQGGPDYFFVYELTETVPPAVTLEATTNPPSGSGLSFELGFRVRNISGGDIDGDFWIEMSGPNGSRKLILLKQDILIPDGQGFSRRTLRDLQEGSFPGDYTFDLFFGEYPDGAIGSTSTTYSYLLFPSMEVTPASFEFNVVPGEIDAARMTIANNGDASLTFEVRDSSVTTARASRPQPVRGEVRHEFSKDEPDPNSGNVPVEGLGGPDAFGYTWIDSDEPGGPAFNWVDISGTGTPVVLTDDAFLEVTLPFTFSFYGVDQSLIKVCSNGYLTFGTDGTDFSNDPIPDTIDPNNLIAPFWDDLNPVEGGTIHYESSSSEFTVQYTDIEHYVGGGEIGTYTFQVTLKASGEIIYQYLSVTGVLNSATIGIEDPAGVDGLEVVYNADYVHDELAVRISRGASWLNESPVSGTVSPDGNREILITADATGLESGSYSAIIIVTGNDPDNPEVQIPVTMNVGASSMTGIESHQEGIPGVFSLDQNYPNPFNPMTTIRYSLPVDSHVRLEVFNMLGESVALLANGIQPAAYHEVEWGGNLSSGMYVYRLSAVAPDNPSSIFTQVKKMIYLK